MKKIFSILALLLMAVTGAWADDTSETINTNTDNTVYTGEHFKITASNHCDEDGIVLWESYHRYHGTATIEALNGEYVTKIEMHMTYGGFAASQTTTTAGELVATNSSSDVNDISVNNVNATSVVIGTTYSGDNWVQIDKFVIYYSAAPAAPTTYSVTLADGTEDADNWTITPNSASEGATVTIKYNGTKKVKSVKAVKKAAALTYPIALSAVTADYLGSVVTTDGNVYATADDAAAASKTAVAMIAYVDGTSGLAIALADEGSRNWETAKSTCVGKTAVGDCSWHLPTQDEWKQMFKAFGNNEESYSGLNTALATANGYSLQEDDNYWSSTDVDGGSAWYVYLIGGGADWNDGSYGNDYHVRACLAF